MTDVAVIVPTRSRPEAVARVAEAWHETHAFEDGAQLVIVYDADDPRAADYDAAISRAQLDPRLPYPGLILRMVEDEWRPMVHKLDRVARLFATSHVAPHLGFAGDDHLPRTSGWVGHHLAAFEADPISIIYCNDGYRGEELPTQWTMSAEIVRALGRMVPAGVEHLYCDDAIRDLGKAAGCLTYLDAVLIEHMNPYATDAEGNRKVEFDQQYRRVNSSRQYATDRAAFRRWHERDLPAQAAKIRDLRRARHRRDRREMIV
jgi:hypothetical protein